jgi:hypothetical protein
MNIYEDIHHAEVSMNIYEGVSVIRRRRTALALLRAQLEQIPPAEQLRALLELLADLPVQELEPSVLVIAPSRPTPKPIVKAKGRRR